MALASDSKDFAAQCALSRFGLGPRAGDLKRIAGDPRGAVEAELAKRDVAILNDPYLISSADAMRAFFMRKGVATLKTGRERGGQAAVAVELMVDKGMLPASAAEEARRKRDRKRAQKRGEDLDAMDDGDGDKMSNAMDGGGSMGGGMDGGGMEAKPKGGGKRFDKDGIKYPTLPGVPMPDEVAARFAQARRCDIGFAERWVMFWTNHLTVSTGGKGFMKWLVGAYEREAIRPNVFGDFSKLLLAATRHPAMLRYLNNANSTGPNSPNGERNGRGLNENHARELLELHTVGVTAGYTQADIIELAKILTGWRFNGDIRDPDYFGFKFRNGVHEPGDRTVMGVVYKDDGVAQGEKVLNDLARKPQTAAHVARRLATYFVSDDPPPALVDRLTKTFRDTDGDLKALAVTLVTSDEAWSAPRAKMRSPQEFVFASARLTDAVPDPELLGATLDTLGQPLWGASSPKGYALFGRDWIAPDSQTNRLDFAVSLAARHADKIDPVSLAEDALGAQMSDETRTAVKRAGSREQAFALFLMSPEMQRR